MVGAGSVAVTGLVAEADGAVLAEAAVPVAVVVLEVVVAVGGACRAGAT